MSRGSISATNGRRRSSRRRPIDRSAIGARSWRWRTSGSAKAGNGMTARRDRYFELYGIFPSFPVIRARLLDETRHACHAAVDGGALRRCERRSRRGMLAAAAESTARRWPPLQQHLRCEGLLETAAAPSRGASTAPRRRLCGPTSAGTCCRPRAFSTPRRATRSLPTVASSTFGPCCARSANASSTPAASSRTALPERRGSRSWDASSIRREYRHALRARRSPGGAPDLIARATEAAAVPSAGRRPRRRLGRSPRVPPPLVALRLPPRPAYHAQCGFAPRSIAATSGPPIRSTRKAAAAISGQEPADVHAVRRDRGGEIPLVRWPTTIGGWKAEKLDDGR